MVNLTAWKALCPRVSLCPIGHKRSDGLEAVNSVVLGAKHMKSLINRFVKDESGATAIEYGLIAALIAVAAISALSSLGDQVEGTFEKASTTIENANAGQG